MNRAQVSFEYFTLIALLILLAAFVTVFAGLLVSNTVGIKSAASSYTEKLLGMMR